MYRALTILFEDASTAAAGSPADLAIHVGDACVFQHGRVLEYGRVQKLAEAEGDRVPDGLPAVLRRATLQDQARHHENALHAKMALSTCLNKAAQHKLALKIHNVRFSFDRNLLSISYMAEERVDYREFLKDVSGEIKTHIEMRQIGVRDAAARVGGMGGCGRRLCCATWLRKFDAVSVKMAKQQRIALNPTAISGMCGRLKCCLRYEQETYRSLAQAMPADGDEVRIPEGTGIVVDRDIPRQRVKVRTADNRIFQRPACDACVLRERRRPADRREPERDEDA